MDYIVLFLILTISIYGLTLILKGKKIVAINEYDINIGVISIVSRCLDELKKRNVFLMRFTWIKPVNVLLISIVLFVFSVIMFNLFIGVLSFSIIVSIPVLISPIVVSKILINNNKRKILNQLPMYVVNIKNHMTEENNIVSAVIKTNVDSPLSTFVNKFKNNVSRGVNVIQALDLLDKDVAVKEFSDLISAIKLCYKNGGNFVPVLEKYILIITKEATYKEETEEKAFSAILTLIIMLILNIIVVFFILNNADYSEIVRTTFAGKMILNFNAISYMVIAGLISKIYKEE